jgi:hypothetical protein
MSLIEGILDTGGRGQWNLDLLEGALNFNLNLRGGSVAWLLLVVAVVVEVVVRVHLSEVS